MRVLPASSAPLRWCLFLRQGAPEGKQGKPEAKSYFMSQSAQVSRVPPAPSPEGKQGKPEGKSYFMSQSAQVSRVPPAPWLAAAP